jgi:acetyl esterase/lipase
MNRFIHRLWTDRAPHATGDEPADIPQLELFLPDEPSGGCVLVCPGGGYGHLASHEGETIGEFFAERKISAAVLKYRIAPQYKHPAPLADVSRAMRTLRHRAGEWRIDPHKLAVMGFSAGGHLASTLSTHFDAGDAKALDLIDRESSRQDASVLCYPVITLEPPFAHVGSRNNLIGVDGPQALVEELSNDKKVTEKTPPTFLFHTVDDDVVPVENAEMYAAALRKNKVPFEMHLYETGKHGVGLASDDARLSTWSGLLVSWLRTRGW